MLFVLLNYLSLSYFVLRLTSEVTNLPNVVLIFHDFPGPTNKFHDFPGLEKEILKFHDFPGFPWPVETLSKIYCLRKHDSNCPCNCKLDDFYAVTGKGSCKKSPKCDAFCLLFNFFGPSTFLMELRDFFIRTLNQSGKSWWVPKFQKAVLKIDYRSQSHLWHHISRFDCNMNYYKVTAWNLLFSVCLALALVQ